MLDISALQSMKVLFATPCYISAVSMNYVVSMYGLACDATQLGLKTVLHMHSESLITRGRNMVVLKFMQDESYTHLFWIDSDISFTTQQVIRLLLADRDVAGGVYPIKSLAWPEPLPGGLSKEEVEIRYARYAFNPVDHGKSPIGQHVDDEGFIEVSEAPTGFMVIKRHVFPRLMQAYPQLNYTPDGPPDNPLKPLHWLFFDCMVDPDSGRYLSEDYAFCRRWRDIGGKVWIDSQSKLQHLGQYNYVGDVETSLKQQGHW